ncbi:isochorismatase family protein [Allonocardiopsis opalescens]|uniref:Bifunctional isochorismate lyase/aryl carrier protein n=1 Tax=Allonocardiopsis opalescens TaxID=1144618 RepID=A0A2T0Q214_9ACTN|nr:isochorismatase family protein [Allonocardiopsis opalescens]PRX97819.1 bifunctional isochorismate lyase/aryl carrier protein [Allonocardiopsis opalescens]
MLRTSALPSIAPYAVPAFTEPTTGPSGWRPEPGRAALLIHDMQRYFLRPYPPAAEPLATALANIAALRAACRAAGVPVLYTAKPGGMPPEQRGLERDFWGAGMREVDEHTAITPELAPAGTDVVIIKRRYSAFVGTGLEQLLRSRGRDQLIVTGVYTHIGCLLTAADAFMRDIQPFLVADATADFTAEDHRSALRYAAGRCAKVLPTAGVLGALASGAVPPPVPAPPGAVGTPGAMRAAPA